MLDRFTWFKQSGYRWVGDGITVYIDPWQLPGSPGPADVIFITHGHFDHYSPDDIDTLRKGDTAIVAPRDVAVELHGDVHAVNPGDIVEARGVKAHAVPAYNIAEDRLDAHPKEKGWVGYLLDLGGTTYYHAGDTDHLPELERLQSSVAFLPIGGSGFTMDGREAGHLARTMSPEIAVPMHYGGFVEGCGEPEDAEVFRREAEPVRVEILTPEVPFPG
jgi:L-ascorbate metabolism protein UlaG (beta-lactamase superfamily)